MMSNALQANTDLLKDIKEFMVIDDLLKCGICYEYFNIAMMTTCSHNYCSLCIRKYMSYKSECPTCFASTSEPELKNNRLLDQLVQSFHSLKCELLRILNSDEERNDCKFKICRKRKNQPPNDVVHKKIKSVECNFDSNEIVIDDDNANGQMKAESTAEKVTCPVCSVEIPQKNINRHIESCLENSEKKYTEPKPKRKILPKLVYHLLSDKELKSKLKKKGLNTIGDRQTLIKRHHLFTIIYNAECDSLKPRSTSEIIQQVVKQEKEEKCNGKTNFTQIKLNCLSRKTDPQVIEQEKKQYLSKHKSQFDDLIKNIKQREKQKNSPEKSKNTRCRLQTSSPTNEDQEITTSANATNDNKKNDVTQSLLCSVNVDDMDLFVDQPSTSGLSFRSSSPVITSTSRDSRGFDPNDYVPEVDSVNVEDNFTIENCDSSDSNASASLLQ